MLRVEKWRELATGVAVFVAAAIAFRLGRSGAGF
jgi:hypothetical protein